MCICTHACFLFLLWYCHHLTSLQILKLYAWEPSYKKKVTEIREQELEVQKSAGYLAVFSMLTLTCIPFLVSVYTISCFDFQIWFACSPLNSLELRFPKWSLLYLNLNFQQMQSLICRDERDESFKDGENFLVHFHWSVFFIFNKILHLCKFFIDWIYAILNLKKYYLYFRLPFQLYYFSWLIPFKQNWKAPYIELERDITFIERFYCVSIRQVICILFHSCDNKVSSHFTRGNGNSLEISLKL